MRKSKSIFLILAVTYVFIYLLSTFHVISINDNVMFGLTASAFLMSLSDVFNNITILRMTRNELGYICSITCNFLQSHISGGITETPFINIVNLKKNIECLVPHYRKMIHPNDFYENKTNKILNTLGNICFVLSITLFVLTPYPAVIMNQQISASLTLLAFSAMCFNIFIEEMIGVYSEKRNNFINNTQILVEYFRPGFTAFLNNNVFFRNESGK